MKVVFGVFVSIGSLGNTVSDDPRQRPLPPVAHPLVAAQRLSQVQPRVAVAQVQQRCLVWISTG